MIRTPIHAPVPLPLLGALALLLLAPRAGAAPQAIELPPGPAERTWAGVGPRTEVPALAPEDLPPEDGSWDGDGAWLAWAELVRAEADALAAGEPADGRRRARLALIAWRQGRSDDAWDHLAACTAEPGWMAAVVPHLLPGVPLDLLLAGGGAPGIGLPEGVILRPALPPPATAAADVVHGLARMPAREMKIERVRIGDAFVSLRVAYEYDGVQVDATLESGEGTHFWIELPEPPDFQIRVEYLDWTRLDRAREPIEIRLSQQHPARYVFGRARPQRLTWGETLPAELTPRLARHGLRLVAAPSHAVGDAGGDVERLGGVAAALRLILGCPAEVVVASAVEPPAPFPGVSLRLADEAERERKLRGLLSLVEHFALARRAP